ncbi:phosphoethanolamine methyltransferase [Dissulfurirhabdus thermomarina]|uniref:Phosphoethanolamine methyltransferase n=1 Tax=Dissulfurirhabdus thermomarina TaxID=1765737 RepID=A0A6N9TM69_DISTH|nr:phosphoethanolamine methyltransferase [Dissulfurirhabdus thermomarina]NMX23488.1 phosphoethanolamine methyltransferase [Dissulfurirhabdus thermomarina]
MDPSVSAAGSAKASRRLSNRERLKAFLDLFKREDRVLVLIVADPDALASALAVRRLLARRVEEVTIAHPNEIKRVNNLAMVELLKIPIQRLRTFKKDDYTKFVLVDSQPSHHPDLERISYDAVIDHHPLTKGWDAPFVDIREDYGAVSTQMTEYLRAAGIKPSVALATALFYGIKTDTHNFAKKASYGDVLSFQYLFKRINQNLLRKIETSDIRRSELKFFRAAFEQMIISKKRIYTHVGKVANPDILVVVADFFTHIHDIGWVIVSGFYGERLVVIFRCDGYKKNAGRLAVKSFGKVGSAGGHRQSARAEVPLQNLDPALVENFSSQVLQRLTVKHISS